MGITWTKEQQEIIDSRNCDLLVAAAAGSGKTAVLVQHILSRILDGEHPIDVDKLLIVTFTKAAAAEMRERIEQAIAEEMVRQPEHEHLQKQAALIHHAHISTIDSFCMWVVKNHFHRLELDPDFRIGEEGEMKLLKADVIKDLLELKYQEEDAEFLRFADAYAGDKGDDNMVSLILQLYDFSRSAPWPEEWLVQCRNSFGKDLQSLEELPWIPALHQEILRKIVSLQEQQTYALNTICRDEECPPEYAAMFRLDRELLAGLLEAESFSDLTVRLSGIKFSTKPRKKKDANPRLEEACTVLRDFIKKEIGNLQGKYCLGSPEQMLETIRRTHEPMNQLIDLTQEFAAAFQAAKKERNVADFADVQHMALELLAGPSELAVELSRQFEEIIIDEYQDSNGIQEWILTAVSRAHQGIHNLFMVGDVKQSIYKFRMAKPELFVEKYNRYSADSGAAERKIDLSRNFRSRRTVLDDVNHLFYQLMGPHLGGIAYTKEAALYPAAPYPEAESEAEVEALATELILVNGDEDAADSREWEVSAIAGRIRSLVDPEMGMRLWDAKAGGYRPAAYRDIVILLRTMDGWADTFVQVLMGRGIPVAAQQKKGYFSAQEVQLILNLLRVIDNPRQDIPLMSVLVSPIGGFTNEEAALLAAEGEGQMEQIGRVTGLYGACLSSSMPKAQAFLERLEHFRELAIHLSIYELLDRILDETDYGLYLAALPAGENRLANIEMLKEKALAFEQTSYHGIFQFNRYIEQIQKYDVDFGEASLLSEQDNLVRITSIHKSKGLEFPIVFVAGTGKAFNLQDTRKSVILHEALGVASDWIDREHRLKHPSLWKRFVADQMVREAKGEELRVLYVALTRAKEKLILTGVLKSRNSDAKWKRMELAKGFSARRLPDWYVAGGNSYLDWILMGMARDAHGIRQIDRDTVNLAEGETWRLAYQAVLRREIEAISGEESYDIESRDVWKRLTEFQYPYEAAAKLRGTVSVSEIKEQMGLATEEERRKRNRTALIPETPGLGALKGTAYHKLMEKIPPKEGTDLEKVKAYIQSFKEHGLLAGEVAAMIRPEAIVGFYQSPLGQRAIAAGKRRLTEQPFVMGIPANELDNRLQETELILVQGMIDACLEEVDGLVLLDYKTDRAEDGDEERLLRNYRVQMEYYKKALEKATGKRVKEAWIYSFALETAISVL